MLPKDVSTWRSESGSELKGAFFGTRGSALGELAWAAGSLAQCLIGFGGLVQGSQETVEVVGRHERVGRENLIRAFLRRGDDEVGEGLLAGCGGSP